MQSNRREKSKSMPEKELYLKNSQKFSSKKYQNAVKPTRKIEIGWIDYNL